MQHRKKQPSSCWHGIEPLEPKLLLFATDLSVAIGALPTDIPTGSTVNVPVTVTNNDATKITGKASLDVVFNDGSGFVPLGSKNVSLSILPGGHQNFVVAVKVPAGAAIGSDTFEAEIEAGVLTSDTTPKTAPVTWDFGNIPGEGNITCTAVDPDSGNTGVFSLTGPGMGTLSEDSNTDMWVMDLTGTTRATKVTVGGAVDLEVIRDLTMVGSISAPQTDFVAATGFEGDSVMDLDGGILSLTMHDVSALAATGHRIEIDAGDFKTDATTFKFNEVNDLQVRTKMPIASFTAADYTANVGNPQVDTTAWIGSISIAGDFIGVDGGDLAMFDAAGTNPANGMGIGSATVGGDMVSSEFFSLYGKIGSVKVGGYMEANTQVECYYNSIGNVSVGKSIDDSDILTEDGNIGSVAIGDNITDDGGIYVEDNGNIGQVTIGGDLAEGSSVYIRNHGNIAGVTIKGDMNTSADIEVANLGNIGPVKIGGNLDSSAQVSIGGNGNIASVFIGGKMDNSAYISTDGESGNIGPVWITGALTDGAFIEADVGSIASVHVGGNMDNSAFISTDGEAGNIGPVWIGGDLNSGASIEIDHGNLASLHIAGKMDNGAKVFTDYGNIGAVSIGGNMDDGAEIFTSDTGNIAGVSIGGNLDNGAYISTDGDDGSIGPVSIMGNLDHGAKVQTYVGNIASVHVGGNMDNGAQISTDGEAGNIGPVSIGGNLDHGCYIMVDHGNLVSLQVGGNVDNGAEVWVDYGNIGKVSIAGNLDNGAEVYVNDAGNVGPVTVGGNLDRGAEVYSNYGDLAGVSIGGNLDNGALVYAAEGNLGNVHVGKNFDHKAQVLANNGTRGIGAVSVGGNFSNGAYVSANGVIKSVTVAGDSLGTSATDNQVEVASNVGIGSISIGGKSAYGVFECGGYIGSIHVGGLMQNGTVSLDDGGVLGSMSVGQLDATNVLVDATASPVGTRADFGSSNSSIGKMTITGVKTAGVTHYITGGSQILAWEIDSLACSGSSTGGSGLIEYHTGHVSNLPVGVTKTVIA